MMTLPDLAKVAALCMRGGDGPVPAYYLAEATQKQITTVMQPPTEEQHGYGYQFWRTRNNGFAMYGIGGQLAFCIPDEDLCVCTVGDTLIDPLGIQNIYSAVFNCLLPRLHEDDNEQERQALQRRLRSLSLPVVKNNRNMKHGILPRIIFRTTQWSFKASGYGKTASVSRTAAASKRCASGSAGWRKGLSPIQTHRAIPARAGLRLACFSYRAMYWARNQAL